jgi:hypothetical protein
MDRHVSICPVESGDLKGSELLEVNDQMTTIPVNLSEC